MTLQNRITRSIIKNRLLYIMLLPGLIYFVLFKYVPLWGILISFQDFQPIKGVAGSEWVGFKHYAHLFGSKDFFMLLKNTLLLSFYNIVFSFPLPIMIALMLNELRHVVMKRFVQTMIYVPHFMSWVIVVGFFFIIFESSDGLFQGILQSLGLNEFSFMLDPDWFRPMYILQILWRDTGWNSIIYLAALTSVDPQLYEAARMDGAGRWRQLWHITLPAIRSTIVIMLILRMGDIMELGFEHIYLLLNPLNRFVAEIFDTYVYTAGILQGQFSYSTAVGMFKAIVGLILVVGANKLAKKMGEEGIY
ncbi:ABC transporter permease [Paenibacillus chungangensis]|uniref:ABC transporter permease n=1 Tax=Paenibacillus chungangensis TaxID=696535 RepID=A0ABW3HUQ6_9BACL